MTIVNLLDSNRHQSLYKNPVDAFIPLKIITGWGAFILNRAEEILQMMPVLVLTKIWFYCTILSNLYNVKVFIKSENLFLLHTGQILYLTNTKLQSSGSSLQLKMMKTVFQSWCYPQKGEYLRKKQ